MKDIPRVQKLNMNMSLAKSILGFRDKSKPLILLTSLNDRLLFTVLSIPQ